MASPLQDFIAHARSKSMDHQTIRQLLLSAGWKEKDIAEALASAALTMPVPSPKDVGSARDAFFHLLAFTTLYATVISLIVLAFQYIGKALPDPAEGMIYYDGSSSAIRWAMASIIVAFPIFLFLSRILYREAQRHPEKLASGVRRWLTYLTLFITAMVLIGDIVTLLFYFLEGELSVRFIMKVLALLVLTGLPFTYYLLTLRMDPGEYVRSPMHLRFRWISIVLVVASFITGFFTVGSPMTGRDQRFDDLRIQQLRQIQSEIHNYVYDFTQPTPTRIRPLPETLEPVASNVTYQRLSLHDPETGVPYEYIVQGNRYSLCAIFALARNLDYDIFWNHPAGQHCFEFDITDLRQK